MPYGRAVIQFWIEWKDGKNAIFLALDAVDADDDDVGVKFYRWPENIIKC